MNRTVFTFIFLLFGSGWGLRSVPTAAAQPTVVRNEATVDFPRAITFELELPPGHDVTAVTLTYDLNQFSCLDADIQVPVTLDGNRASWTLELTRAGNVPPGASLWWEWTLTDAAGSITTMPQQTLTLRDDRFQWQTVEAEGVRLHWYDGETVGPELLEAAVDGLALLEAEMGIELQDEVQMFIYGDSQEMREALLFVQGWAGGVAFSDFNIILLGVPPRLVDSWGVDVVPHELAHLVVAQFGRSCVGGSRPTWLEEGLAMVAEGYPGADTRADIANGISNNAFEPLRSLNGAFASDHSQAGLSYSQSYSVVDYLLETYGRDQMQQLIQTLADGSGYDEALTAVYGKNVDGIETEWRAAIGAPPRTIPPTPTPLLAAAVPTYEPSGLPQSVPTPPAAATPPTVPQQRPSAGICGLGLVLPLLGVFLSKKRWGGEDA